MKPAPMSEGSSPRFTGALRGVGLAIWSWLVLAGTLALFSGQRYVEAALGAQASDAAMARLDAPSYVEMFVSVLTLDFGRSLVVSPGTGAWAVLGPRVGTTMLVAGLGVVLSAALAAPLVALARSGAGRLVEGLGYLGALPAFGWALVLFYLGREGYIGMPAVGGQDLGAAFSPALTVAVVVAAAVGRAAARDDLVLDAWLYAVWGVGALVVAEAVFAVPGLGHLWVISLVQGDYAVFVGATVLLTLPLLVASVVREASWGARADAASGAAGSRADLETDGGITRSVEEDEGSTPDTDAAATLGAAVRRNRQVQAGLLAFAVLLVGGLLMSGATTASPLRPSPGTLDLARVADGLGAVALTALVGVVAASALGIPLGAFAARSRTAGTVARLVDHATSVPTLAFVGVWVAVFGFSGNALMTELLVGWLAGVAVAPLVLRTTERACRRGASTAEAVVPALGLALTGGAVVAFVAAEIALLGLGLQPLAAVVGVQRYPARTLTETVLAVALPALTLLVAGEGLRTAA